jgi:diguanylate cyclase (GGDEF)-like protein/PAS domain S-box-containing protein
MARLGSAGVLIGKRVGAEPGPWSAELAMVFEAQPIGSNLYAGLRIGGVLIGVIGIGSMDETYTWTADEMVTVQQVADTLANCLGRQRADSALRASEEYLSAMLANVGDILVVLDGDGYLRYVNAPVFATTGYQPEELVGEHFLYLVHPDDQELAVSRFALALAGGGQLPITELRLIHRDGSSVWFDVDASGVYDPVVGGYLLSLRNVSIQRATQEAGARRLELEHVLFELSEWAIEIAGDEILGGLDVRLEPLGRALGVDSVFALLLDGDRLHHAASWRGTGSPQLGSVEHGGGALLPAIATHWRANKSMIVSDILDCEGDWCDEWRSFPEFDRSSLSVPLISGGRCLGVLGVAMTKAPREWLDDEISLVQRASEMVAAVLARQRVEASLQRSELRLGALLNGSQDLVVVLSDDGVLLYANQAAERSLGYAHDELIGLEVLHIVHPDDLALAAERMATLVADEPTTLTTLRLVAKDGTCGWWAVTAGVARDPIAGGRVLTCRNVTEQRAIERDSERRVEHLRYAFTVAQSALDLDAQEFLDHLPEVCADIASMLEVDFVYVDQLVEPKQMLVNIAGYTANGAVQGVTSGQSMTFDRLPLWIERLRRTDPIVVRDPLTFDEAWLAEKRAVLGSEGGLVAVAMSAAGELFGVLGVSMWKRGRDWTDDEVMFLRIIAETVAHVFERSRVDEALRASEARFRLLSETAADVVLLLDGHGTLVYASPSSAGLVGFSPDELTGRTIQDLVHPDDLGELLRLSRRMSSSGQFTSEIRLLKADGEYVWVENSTSALIDETGAAVEFRASVRDITMRKRLEAELERQALHDPLTGLCNRILLQSRLEMAAAQRGAVNVSVLLVDLDGFKAVNDTFGHSVGDDVLRVVASRLTRLARPGDTLARTGGDEFVLLCPDTNRVAAAAIGDRIVRAVSQPLSTGGVMVQLGASVGAAHQVGPGIDPDWLLIEADHAMYAAKRAGRNCIRLAGDGVTAAVQPAS